MDTDEFDDEYNIESLFSDMPEVNRLGFYTDSSLNLWPEYPRVTAKLQELADAGEGFTDDEGYVWLITAYSIDDDHRRVAWVEWRDRDRGRIVNDNYYLKARDESGALFLWEIETYNPYFGCSVRFLNWIDDAVVLIYEDKHDTFVAVMRKDQDVQRVEITDDWAVQGDVLTYGTASPDEIRRLRLPSLEEVE